MAGWVAGEGRGRTVWGGYRTMAGRCRWNRSSVQSPAAASASSGARRPWTARVASTGDAGSGRGGVPPPGIPPPRRRAQTPPAVGGPLAVRQLTAVTRWRWWGVAGECGRRSTGQVSRPAAKDDRAETNTTKKFIAYGLSKRRFQRHDRVPRNFAWWCAVAFVRDDGQVMSNDTSDFDFVSKQQLWSTSLVSTI